MLLNNFKFNLTTATCQDAVARLLGHFESAKQERVKPFFPEIRYVKDV